MNPQNKWLKVAGIVLNVLIAALMIFAGSGKAFGFAPPEVMEQMSHIRGWGGQFVVPIPRVAVLA